MDAIADWIAAPGHDVARWVLQRGVGLTWLLAFANVWWQFPPLLGDHGLLPAREVVANRSFWEAPSLFHWRGGDATVRVVAGVGIVLGLGGLVGLTDLLPLAVALAWWLLAWALYLSVVNVGRVFYAFGWESLLCEAGFLVAFLGTDDVAAPWPILALVWWLLFRVEFGAGLIKLRGDPCWRDLTCLDYHHQTQPMPGPLSWYFHHLPRRLHRVETAANHVAQLVAPVLLVAPQPVRGSAGLVMVVTQGWLLVSGNYAWLNFVTFVLALSTLPDAWVEAVTGWAGPVASGRAATPDWFVVVVLAVTALMVALAWGPVANMASPRQRMNTSFNRWHLSNSYGAFGSVTRRRREVVVEASRAEDPGPADWFAYEFRAKPTDVARRPPQYAPRHLRLDWLMWFLPLSPGYGRGWFSALLQRLLDADPVVLRLLRRAPFGDLPPRWVRARLVDYRFTTPAERRATGDWWVAGRSREFTAPRRGVDQP